MKILQKDLSAHALLAPGTYLEVTAANSGVRTASSLPASPCTAYSAGAGDEVSQIDLGEFAENSPPRQCAESAAKCSRIFSRFGAEAPSRDALDLKGAAVRAGFSAASAGFPAAMHCSSGDNCLAFQIEVANEQATARAELTLPFISLGGRSITVRVEDSRPLERAVGR
jgi:hypothetical protein